MGGWRGQKEKKEVDVKDQSKPDSSLRTKRTNSHFFDSTTSSLPPEVRTVQEKLLGNAEIRLDGVEESGYIQLVTLELTSACLSAYFLCLYLFSIFIDLTGQSR